MKVIDLPESSLEIYQQIPPDMRQRLVSLIKKMEEYSSYTLPDIINQYRFQCDDFPRSNVALCAGTQIPLKARGINAPNVWRLNQEDGYAPNNVVIVSAGYANLRRQIRLFGKEAHVYAIEWAREAVANWDARVSKAQAETPPSMPELDDYMFEDVYTLPEQPEEEEDVQAMLERFADNSGDSL